MSNSSTITNVSWLKRVFWKRWYNLLSRKFTQPDIIFLNYGYAYDPTDEKRPRLAAEDEAHRVFIQLYHRVIGSVELTGKDVVEIGSGRGGGARYLAAYGEPRSYTGIDLSEQAIRFCRDRHALPGLTFQQGEAENTGLESASADVALNVESSHCYPSRARFFAEVHRILRPGGSFLWADLLPAQDVPGLIATLNETGFQVIEEEEITPGVLTALDQISGERSTLIRRIAPFWLRKPLLLFAGTPGTLVYERLKSGELKYMRCRLRKP